MHQLLDLKRLLNDCFSFQLLTVFAEHFISDIFTYFFICVNILDKNKEIEIFVWIFLISAVYDYIVMVTVILLNSLVNREVS